MKTLSDMIVYLLVTATIQNVVLTTGFGSSSLARMLRRPRQRYLFSGLLLGFSVATTAVFFPIDHCLPAVWQWRMLRPLIVVMITAFLYVAATLVTAHRFPEWYRRVRRFMPLAAFNNIVIGVALVTNYQFAVSFLPAVGMAVGSSLGFALISAMSAEALERMDNPEIPAAFRGLPGTLVYLGLLALALMGFQPILNLI